MRAEMAYCGPRGIPHSEFLSWPVDDQAKALGWMAEESQKCPGCGTAEWEREDGDPFSVQVYHCRVCARVQNAQSGTAKTKAPGMHVQVVRNGGPDGG